MNEGSQIEAMAAELVAMGYSVGRDLVASTSGLPGFDELGDLTLDLVGIREEPIVFTSEQPDAIVIEPKAIIIEVANRQFRGIPKSPNLAVRRQVIEDDVAVERFRKISAAIANRRWIDFEIRFLDISADVAAARKLESASARTNERLKAQLVEGLALFGSVRDKSTQVRALVIARMWTHWLRLIAYRFPARDHRELKLADLRTIQKDLYDQKVLTMSPRTYAKHHSQLLAVVEGGDVNCSSLLKLEEPLQEIWLWAHKTIGDETSDAAFVTVAGSADRDGRTAVSRAAAEMREVSPADLRGTIERYLAQLDFAWDSPTYGVILAQFQHEVGRQSGLSESTWDELIAHAGELAL